MYNKVDNGLCSHGLESRSEWRFRTWLGPFLIKKPDFSPCERKVVSIRLLKRILKREKKGVLDRDPPTKPDSRTCERKALSERDSCVCILKMRAEAMHKHIVQSARGLRSRSKILPRSAQILIVIGKTLQCMWTHIVQITIPITFWIAIRNVFRNVIRSHVNTSQCQEVYYNKFLIVNCMSIAIVCWVITHHSEIYIYTKMWLYSKFNTQGHLHLHLF